MRQVVLDTETTGLDPAAGHRIVELAALELVDRRLTGNRLHHFLNPGRDIDAGALEVHGITLEFLADKPCFADIAEEFLAFVADAQLVIHNAPFDVGFLDQELRLAGRPTLTELEVDILDTLALARSRYPGQKNSLDALCKRLGVDNSNRTLHGALLDAELLAEVYLAMTRGQESLLIELASVPAWQPLPQELAGRPLRVVRAIAAELAAHEALLDDIEKESKGACVWRTYPAE